MRSEVDPLTQIFAHVLDNIPVSEGKYPEQLKKARNNLLSPDREYLKDKNIFIDISNITADLPNGRFYTIYNNIRFEMLFNYKKGLPLIVVLNGSKTSMYPEFKRWSWYTFFQGSMLNIADPMYDLYKDLNLGWYFGNDKVDIRRVIVDMILQITAYYNIPNKDIILYSSSGGGAACFEIASLIGGGCTCITINPQIYIYDYYYAPFFERITNLKVGGKDEFERNNTEYWIKRKTDVKYIFIENLASRCDREDIYKLAKNFRIDLKYGLTKKDNIIVWTYEAETDTPHGAQEEYCTYFQIFFLRKLFDDDELIERYRNLYCLFSEQWRKQWALINTNEHADREIREVQLSKQIEKIIDDFLVSPTNNDFNNAVLFDCLAPRTTYTIEFYGIKLLGTTSKIVTFGVKDKLQNKLIFRKDIDIVNDGCVISICTGARADSLEVKIYAGQAFHTNGVSLSVQKVIIYKHLSENKANKESGAVTDLTLFEDNQRLNKQLNEVEKDRDKWRRYSDLFKQLLVCNKIVGQFGHDNPVVEDLKQNGYVNIAIYGYSEITKIFIHILKDTEIKIRYIVENGNIQLTGIPIYPRSLEQYPKCDIIFVADIQNYDYILNKLKNQGANYNICSLERYLRRISE